LFGFSIALQPPHLMWTVLGVVAGNVIGVLPGIGALAAISILLPVTFTMHPVSAIVMLSGLFYGSIYGGAIGAILLNLPVHPSHAVTCLDGYPLTQRGRGGAALFIAMIAAVFSSTVGIVIMVMFSPVLVSAAFKFGPVEVFSIMLLGLIAGSTMSKGSPIKGIAMTLFGMFLGAFGMDVNSGIPRFAFNVLDLQDGVSLVALALGIFCVAEFLKNVNRMAVIKEHLRIRLRDLIPTRKEFKESIVPMLRGTAVGTAFGALPGTGPMITPFVAYALESKVSKHRARLGTGFMGGVASAEAAAHSKTQVDFIPTMALGIPGDPVMALLLGALLIQGIQPGPQLITTHEDIFWGLVASFWIGNFILMILNIPMVGLWVKLLNVPYKYLFSSALFFIAIGAYASNNTVFEVCEVLAFGVIGFMFIYCGFSMAPVLLGFILGPMVEDNFRRALMISNGDLFVFVSHPISAIFCGLSLFLVVGQLILFVRKKMAGGIKHATIGTVLGK
jgi:TctA family transporter